MSYQRFDHLPSAAKPLETAAPQPNCKVRRCDSGGQWTSCSSHSSLDLNLLFDIPHLHSMSAITHILSRLGPRDRARAALVNKVDEADVCVMPMSSQACTRATHREVYLGSLRSVKIVFCLMVCSQVQSWDAAAGMGSCGRAPQPLGDHRPVRPSAGGRPAVTAAAQLTCAPAPASSGAGICCRHQ